MSSSPIEVRPPAAYAVRLTDDLLIVELLDGRILSVPIAWYPRLLAATSNERSDWRLVGRGEGIHWPGLDEDISVAALLAGHGSAETQSSLKRWLAARQA